jgi:tetratricopeptide (TPR) repeat protein
MNSPVHKAFTEILRRLPNFAPAVSAGIVLSLFALGLSLPDAGAETGEPVAADSLRKYRFLAKTAREKKQTEDALRYYGQVIHYKPDDLKAHYFSGSLLANKGDTAAAKRHLLICVALDSLHVNSNVLLTQLYLRQEDPDSAWVFLEPVFDIKPAVSKYHRFRRQIADLHRIQGNHKAAISHYEALAANSETDARQIFELLSQLHEANGDTEQALALSSRALSSPASETSPSAIEILSRVLELQASSGDRSGAYETLRQLVRLDSLSRYSYFDRMAAIATDAGDLSQQVEGLEGMVEAQPHDLGPLATLVELHLKGNDLNAASTWLRRGLKVDKKDGHLLLLQGELLILQGDEDAAIAAFERSRQDPEWEKVAQQRIWQLRPPETEEEKLKRSFFGE